MGKMCSFLWKLTILVTLMNLGGRVNGDDAGNFGIGVGIADVTGPAADIGMMGYASPTQSARGIHTRLFSRAFVFESEGERVVYVSADIGMVDQAIKSEVVRELQLRFGSTYTYRNVLLSGTHTHSGPAGYIQYLLYGITSLGFDNPNFKSIVDGIVQSIQRAHANVKPGKILYNVGEVEGANINRSPTSYMANPAAEREKYTHNVDKDMNLVRLEATDGTPLGTINWFPVHPTSMNNTNTLLSGDNKGYASMLFEHKMNPDARPGKGAFVAAFGAANLGDVSPNTNGPICIGTGESCDNAESTCCNELGCFVARCIAFGPGKDMEESTKIIGENQFNKANELYEGATEAITGPVQYQHQFVNMSSFEVEITNSTGQKELKKLCKAALGYSFAAGTTDGPGAFDFTQGAVTGNPFWDYIKRWLINATDEIQECQNPKPVLLAVGEAFWPYEWVPSIVEIQVLRVGNLYILGVPGELTTMAGRRLRTVVEELVLDKQVPGSPPPRVVIAGLSNVYTHYISTFEEYQMQRYEAASTIFGPYTLDAYLQQYPMLVETMLDGTTIDAGPSPPNLLDQQFTLVPPIQQDTAPFTMTFGDVWEEPSPRIAPGDMVKVIFVGGHPKNNAMREGTFLTIERDEGSARWQLVRTDADWDTKFRWSRPSTGSSQSRLEITWETPTDIPEGFYRIKHFGYYKPSPEEPPRPYQGSSSVFQIVATGSQPNSHPLWNPNQKPTKSIKTTGEFWHALSNQRNVN